MKIDIPTPQIRAFALVRDAHGRPKIDDPDNCPPEILAMLTPEEREALHANS